jgi:hypothetical protein
MLRVSPILILSGESDHRDKLADRVSKCGAAFAVIEFASRPRTDSIEVFGDFGPE